MVSEAVTGSLFPAGTQDAGPNEGHLHSWRRMVVRSPGPDQIETNERNDERHRREVALRERVKETGQRIGVPQVPRPEGFWLS